MSNTHIASVGALRALRNSIVAFLLIAALTASITWQASETALAATYTYTPTNTATDLWSAGTNWDAIPVSAQTSELTFVGDNTMVLADGLTNTNTNDIVNGTTIGRLNLQGTGPANGAATINIDSSTSMLNVASPQGNTVINLNALSGVAGLTYNVNCPVELPFGATFQGDGTANFNFNALWGMSGLVKSGSSTLTISGGYSGGTTINGGVLRLGSANVLGGSTLDYGSYGGVLSFGGLSAASFGGLKGNQDLALTNESSGPVALTISGGATTYSGVLSGAGSLTMADGQLTLTGKNTYTGNTTVTGGTLCFSNGSLDSTNSIVFNSGTGGTLEWATGNNQDISSLIAPIPSGRWAVLDVNNNNVTFSSTLSGLGGLTKTYGGGTLTLKGANTYAGGTTVLDGTLTAVNASALPNYDVSGKVVVYGGATLAVNAGGDGEWTAAQIGALCSNATFTGGALGIDTTNATNGLTCFGIMSGSMALTKLGANTLILTAANTFSGTTTVSAGTLQLGDETTSNGFVTGNIVNNSALVFANPNDLTYSGVVSGTGTLTKTGNGTLTLSGANTLSGPTTINGGTLTVGNAAALQNSSLNYAGGAVTFGAVTNATFGGLSGDGALSLTNGSSAPVVLTVGANNQSTTYAGVLSGSGGLTKTGTGMLTLVGASSYSGDTTISNGTLVLGNTNALQNSCLNNVGGTLSFGTLTSATLGGLKGSRSLVLVNSNSLPVALTVGNDVQDTTYSGVLSGAGTLIKVGSATFTLSGANTYTGDTKLLGGRLLLVGTLGSSTLDYSGYGGTIGFGTSTSATFGGLKGNQDLSLANDSSAGVWLTIGGNNQSSTFSGLLSGAGGLNKVGTGTLTLARANTFSGGMGVSNGTLVLGDSNALQNSCLNYTGGTVSLGTLTNVAIGGLSGNQPLALTNDSSQPIALTIGSSTGGNYSGVLSGAGSLTKVGTNSQTLGGANTFTGGTKIYGGTLLISNSNALQNSTLDNSCGGTLRFTGLSTASLGGLKGNQDLSLLDNMNPTYGVSLSVGGNNESTTFGGVLCGAPHFGGPFGSGGLLTKIGTGTLTITNMNTAYVSVPAVVSGGALQLGDGTTNGSIAGNITNNASLIFNNGSDQTFSNVISGSGTVTKTGAGTLTFASTSYGQTVPTSNSYAGGTIISGGTLNVSADASLGAAPATAQTNITFNGNGTLQWGAAFNLNANRQISVGSGATATFDIAAQYINNYTYTPGSTTIAGAISGDGGISKTGAGTVILSGSNSYAGGTSIVNGVLQAAKKSALPGYGTAGKIVVNTGATLAVNIGGSGEWTDADLSALRTNVAFNAGSLLGLDTTNAPNGSFIYSGSFTGDVGLAKLGSGSLTLTSQQSYNGPTFISGGQLVLAGGENCLPTTAAVTLGAGGGLVVNQDQTIASLSGSGGSSGGYFPPFGYAGVTVSTGSTLIFGDSTNTTYSGGFGGGGQVIKRGTGTFDFTGLPQYYFSGNITVTEGTFQCEGLLPAPVTNNSAVVFNLAQGSSSSIGGPSYSTVYISGSGSVSKIGAGTMTLGLPTTYFGDTTICGGQLILNHVNALQNTTLDYDNYGGVIGFGTLTAVTFGGLKGCQDLLLSNSGSAAVALTVGNNGQSTVYSGVLGGSGSLIKIGTGVLTLSGANCYAGVTTVEAGTLALGLNNALPTASDVILAGGTLATNGFSQTNSLGTLTLAANSTLDLGGAGGCILSFLDSHTAAWSGTLTIADWNGSMTGGGADELLFGSSDSALTLTQLSDMIFTNPNGLMGDYQATILATGEVVPGAKIVPEPAVIALLLSGGFFGGGLALRRWRRRGVWAMDWQNA